MKHKLLATSLLCLALGSAPVHADLLYWSANGSTVSGVGTWDTTNQRWGTDTSGPFTTVWNNAVTNDATLSASGAAFGSVVMGVNITMNGTLSMEQTPGTWPSWTINGANTMTFGLGSTLLAPTINSSSINGKYAGTITKTGAGTIIFNNSGGNVTKFILKQGISTFSANNRLGSGADRSDFLTFDGGTLRADTSAWGVAGKSISLTANGGTIAPSSSTVTMTFDKPITSTGAGRLSITSGQITLSSTGNAWTGPMTISGTSAKLILGAANVIPDSCVLTCSSTLNLANFSETISSLSGAGAVTLGSGTLTLANGRNTFSGPITGTGGLVQNSTSFETLSGANTYSGATTINSGALVFSGASTCTGVTTVNSGGTLRLATSGTAFPSSPIVLAAGGTLDVNSLSATIAALSGSGNVSNNLGQTLTVNGDLTTAGTVNFTGYQVYSCYSGALTNGGLYKSGTHAMALRGSNTFDGTVGTFLTFDNGTLSVGAGPDRLPPTTALGLNSPALFQLDANSQAVGSLNGNGSLNLGGGTLTVNDAGNSAFSGVIQNSELPGSSTALGHGLRGYYYDNIDMTNLKAVRDDATVNFTDFTVTNNSTALPDAGIATNTFSVRWLGQVLTTAAGTYNFTTACDDGRRLWVNGELVVDSWVSGATTKSGTNTIALAANTKYDIVMEFFNGSGATSARLLWTPPGDTTTNVIPTEYLFLPGPGALVMVGTGTLTLSGANTYSGNTIVAAGTLFAQADGALGNGNVTVSNANLTLQSGLTNGYLSPSANLLLNGTAVSGMMVTLGFSGAEDIHGLSYNGGATYQAAGTYGSSSSSATHQDDTRFSTSGSGILNVVGAPSTTVLTSSGSPSATYGSPLTLTATVTPSGVTGTATFYDGANWLGSSALNGVGVATLSVNNLQVTASPHALTAVYSGDATHAPSTSGSVSQTTTPAPLTPNVVVSNKVYDATITASISSATTFTGILSGDTNYVHISGTAVANFDTKDKGVGKTVTITGMTLSGSLASNYSMPTATATVFSDITARALTVTGLTPVSRPYDTTTSATFGGAAVLNGVLGIENVTLNTSAAVASFATKTVGTNKVVTVNGYTLNGLDAGNYSVTPPTLTANITSVSLAVVGLTANGRIYDGTTNATFSGTATLSGVIGSDVVNLVVGAPVASFNDKTAANSKPVKVIGGYTITGADAANYTVAQPAGLTANITPDATTCAVASSANPSTLAANVTFTATVSGVTPAADSPTGSVAFFIDDALVGTPAVTAAGPNTATASYSIAGLSQGAHTVKAQYGGDSNFAVSPMSSVLTQTVSVATSPVTITNIIGTTLTYGGGAGTKFILLKSATVNALMSTWTYPGLTNTATPGSFTIPAVGTGTPVFYRIQSE